MSRTSFADCSLIHWSYYVKFIFSEQVKSVQYTPYLIIVAC